MRKGWDNVTHFQRIGFLNISGKANVNMLCQKYGKHIGTHKHSEVMGFVNIQRETEIHAITKTWNK